MKTLAALLALALMSGCKVHPSHPHGAPPGQVKKAVYKCGSCGVTKSAAGTCHGSALIIVP